MPYLVQREGALYRLFLNLDKTFLIRAGEARRTARVPELKAFRGRRVRCVDAKRTLGFGLGPLVIIKATLQARGKGMIAHMDRYKIVW